MSQPRPPVWPRRVVVVGDDEVAVVRGRSAEFLHAGIALTRVPSATAALISLADPDGAAVVLVPVDPPGMRLADFLGVVDALGRTAVVLGVPPAPDAAVAPGPARTGAFATAELPVTPARLSSVLDIVMRSEAVEAPIYRCGELVLDSRSFRVLWHGRDVRLTPSSFDLLEYLMAASPRIVRTEELASGVAATGSGNASERVRARVRRVRDQLKAAVPGVPPPLETITRVGYRITSGSTPITRRLETTGSR